MAIHAHAPDDVVLDELGERLARTRLRRELTQRELAAEAGIGVATVKRLERGHAVGTDNLLRVLRALRLIEGLDVLVPPPPPSPLERLEHAGRERRRVRHSREAAAEPDTWTWGDEPDAPPALSATRAG
jgi:transcriptional regulator with XRE-family HTH domain